MIANILLIFMT